MQQDKWIELLASGTCSKVVVLTGAGVSVAAGIAPFRGADGLYAKVDVTSLSLSRFLDDPVPFYFFVRELWIDKEYQPTEAHRFVSELSKRGLLLRLYTQNIDGLHRKSGVPEDKMIEMHGNFQTASCAKCKFPTPVSRVLVAIKVGTTAECALCGSPCKPDIVLFGEEITARFQNMYKDDFEQADMFIVMGTSFKVLPAAHLLFMVRPECPRVCFDINPTAATNAWLQAPYVDVSQCFLTDKNRDTMVQGDIEDEVKKVLTKLQW